MKKLIAVLGMLSCYRHVLIRQTEQEILPARIVLTGLIILPVARVVIRHHMNGCRITHRTPHLRKIQPIRKKTPAIIKRYTQPA